MRQTTICMINQKGGCGKSSTCFHLAGHFAENGRSVLLIDADPQGSLSQGFLGSSLVENLESSETLTALFDDRLYFRSAQFLPMATPFQRVTLVPANQTLAPHNTPSPALERMKQRALRSFLDELDGFDIVLIDCPPNLYLCSWNAMVAADFVIVPVPPEDFGTQGLRVVHQAIGNATRLNPKLALLGHLVTRSDARLLVHQSYEKKLRDVYGPAMFDVVVPEASAFKVALACREPVTRYSPKSKAARVMHRLGEEIERRIVGRTARREVA